MRAFRLRVDSSYLAFECEGGRQTNEINRAKGASLVHLPLSLWKHLGEGRPELFPCVVDYLFRDEHEKSGGDG
jgi:hypothetical protein